MPAGRPGYQVDELPLRDADWLRQISPKTEAKGNVIDDTRTFESKNSACR
jgi:hypothetical protein